MSKCKIHNTCSNWSLTVNLVFAQVTMAGDFILAMASIMIARLKNNDVTLVLSQVSRNW
jgi:geranylgeranyl pyrophosphate synthase